MIQVIRMVTVSVIIPVEPIFLKKRRMMHTSSMCIIGVELSSRIGSEEITIHCSCSAIIVVMMLTTPLYKCTSCTYEHARLHAAATV